MNKPIWEKLIVCVVAWMILINSILPTTNFASLIEDNLEKYYSKIEITKTDKYSIFAVNSVTNENFPADMDRFIVYYKDESGAIKPVETDENGYMELEMRNDCLLC